MTIARKYLIDYTRTCYYHCMSRCVCQDFLLGQKHQMGSVSRKRKDWIEKRVLFLGNIFAIDVLSFSIMDNHTHTVLHANLSLASQWSNVEVLRRWSQLGKIPLLCQFYLDIDYRCNLSEEQLDVVLEQIASYRQKLSCISTFMSKLNSYIARRANKEDGRKGHFWEGRFKSQALLDSDAVLACMAYVDLNPVRAGSADCHENAPYTSIKRRLGTSKDLKNTFLTAFRQEHSCHSANCVSHVSLFEYCQYLDSALMYKKQKDLKLADFAESESIWIKTAIEFEDHFTFAAGSDEQVTSFVKNTRTRSKQKSFTKLNTTYSFPVQ